jgi:hypothetical protein
MMELTNAARDLNCFMPCQSGAIHHTPILDGMRSSGLDVLPGGRFKTMMIDHARTSSLISVVSHGMELTYK